MMILFIYSRVKLCFSSKEIYTTVICGFHNTSVTFCSFICKGFFFLFSRQRREMILEKKNKKKGRFSNSVHIVDGLDSLTPIEFHGISGL